MKNIILVTVMFIAALAILVVADFKTGSVKVYDCGMAEWHPDIPKAVKEECRRIHYEEWKKEREEGNSKKLVI